MSKTLAELFDRNRQWATDTEAHTPGFFTGLLAQQQPKYMWLGCADSRVPANELVDLLPGELFVHRNVANLLVHSDLNALSVIQYAVDVLGVEHIIVVGHSNCGGIRAALNNQRAGLVDNWLRHVQDVRDAQAGFLMGLDASLRVDALVELNVLEQARNVCRCPWLGLWFAQRIAARHGCDRRYGRRSHPSLRSCPACLAPALACAPPSFANP